MEKKENFSSKYNEKATENSVAEIQRAVFLACFRRSSLTESTTDWP